MDFIQSAFDAAKGWTTQFEIGGKKYGGEVDILTNDPRLLWHLEQIGGCAGKRILELGPLEGAHTKMMIDAGAGYVLGIEGNAECYKRCLIIKEVFNLQYVDFYLADFCDFISEFKYNKFDFISAAGVLYHQTNPVKLIYDMARITDTVLVWSQVANASKPSNENSQIIHDGKAYNGKINNYNGIRGKLQSYCGGLNDTAFWLYKEDMLRCFRDAGFTNIILGESEPTVNGDSVLFVAKKE